MNILAKQIGYLSALFVNPYIGTEVDSCNGLHTSHSRSHIKESGIPASKADGVRFIKNEDKKTLFEVRSGPIILSRQTGLHPE
jgi:hypothetical protein